jgi:hypothetical protein
MGRPRSAVPFVALVAGYVQALPTAVPKPT